MARQGGVSYYTWGHLEIDVPFPEDMTQCQWCPFVRNEDSLKRWRCLITGEYLPFPFVSRGNQCPIIFDTEEDGENEDISAFE